MLTNLLYYYYDNGGATKVKRIALSKDDWNEAFDEMKALGEYYVDEEATREGYENFLFKGIAVVLDDSNASL